MTQEIPEYLGRERAKERKMIARFRCGNEERKHVLDGRKVKREREILNEDAREIRWIKKIWKRRERIEKERGGNRNKNVILFMVSFWCKIFTHHLKKSFVQVLDSFMGCNLGNICAKAEQ
jgi:hypothetical protein